MQKEKLILPSVDLGRCQSTADYALAFARAGMPVIPLYTALKPGVCSCGKTDCASVAKHPRTKSWKDDKSVDPGDIKRWFARETNLGVTTGGGVFVLDIDEGKHGHESMYELEQKHGALPPTLTVTTGGGGVHYYFLSDEFIKNSASDIAPGVDIRGHNGYVVGPGSMHASGTKYCVDEGQPYDIARAPEWLVNLAKENKRRERKPAGDSPDVIIHGARNEHLTSVGGSMRRRGFSKKAILQALLTENDEKCSPPLSQKEVMTVANSLSNYTPNNGAQPAADPSDYADWRSALKLTKEGNVSKDAGNAALLLSNESMWDGVLRYDEFEDIIRFAKAPPPIVGLPVIKKGDVLSDPAITFVQHWLGKRTGASFTETATVQGITAAAHKNKFHPVQDYLSSLEWDGVERLPTWLHKYFGADECEMYERIGLWWMIGAVARIIKPGSQVDHMLVLEGPQGLGKSTAARILGGKWHLGSLPDLRNSQNASMLIQGYWIVEAGELDAFKQAGSARIKDFLTQTVDVYRRPYARTFQRRPRQCSLIGTTNEMTYLSDPTGNRRYWPCRVRKLAKEELERDRDQLWAEAVARYKRGEAWHPGDNLKIELKQAQEQRVMGDIWEEKISAYLVKEGQTFVTGSAIMHHLGLEISKIERRHQMRVAECMQRLGWTPGRKKVGTTRKRGFLAPKNFLHFIADTQ